MTLKPIFVMCKMWSLNLTIWSTPSQGHDTILRNIIKIQLDSEALHMTQAQISVTLWLRPSVKVMTHCWVKDNNCVRYYPAPTVRYYGPDPDFGFLYAVKLTLKIWPWVKIMAHTRVLSWPWLGGCHMAFWYCQRNCLKAILRLFIYKALYDQSYLGSKTTMTTGEWPCLISFAWDPLTCSDRRGGSEQFKMKIFVSSGIRTHASPRHD